MSGPLHSAASVEHYTPGDLVEKFRYVLGGKFALDPASNEFANRLIQAKCIFTETYNGLSQRWEGPLILNPPGKSKTNPGGASEWWVKLVKEWERDLSWSAIYVGFSLEILQTAQSYSYKAIASRAILQPCDFHFCIPKRRIAFDVETTVLLVQLQEKLVEHLARHGHQLEMKKRRQLEQKLEFVKAAHERGEERLPGDSPTHGNILVCLAHEAAVAKRFNEAMQDVGWTKNVDGERLGYFDTDGKRLGYAS